MNAAAASRGPLMIGAGLALATAWSIPSYFRSDAPLLPPAVVVGGLMALALGLLPARATGIGGVIDALNALTGRRRVWAAALMGCASSLVLGTLTRALGRPLRLLWHDEFQFHLQSQLVARGRLWMPPHPLGDFFDTFYVLMQPRYAPQSFPGASLLFAPTVWLHLPTWLMPVLVSGAACGLLWWVLAELVDPVGATAALVVLLCDWGFLRVSTMYLAQVPVLAMGLAAISAMLVWQRTHGARAAAATGAFLGWAAITRPLDAACYGAIVLVGMLSARRGAGARRVLRAGVVAMAAALPFLALQGAFNVGVTGSLTKTPFALYNERDQPALAFGAVGDVAKRPLSSVPQKQAFYDFSTLGFVQLYNDPRMRPSILWKIRLNETQAMLAPALMMLPFAAFGLAGLVTRRRWLLFGLVPLFVATYHWYPIYHSHYVTFALPGLVLPFALAPEVARTISPRFVGVATRAVAAVTVGMSLGALVDRATTEEPDEMLRDRVAAEKLLEPVRAPAIVLFTAPARPEDMHTEFVYNDDVAWPDDAPIIRAHDRGGRNTELYRYYASAQPQREIWRFDRRSGQLLRLGTARELAAALGAQVRARP